MRRLPVSFWVVVLFILGVWVGVMLAARSWPAGLIENINREVNSVDVRSQPLEPGGDRDGVFDCEDYALLKRRRLIEAGIKPADIRIWAVTTRRGERHAVLEVKGVILDNLASWTIPKDEARYYSNWSRQDWRAGPK